jgi:DNA invertase Pin-like site-specific DNA recombinase
MKYGLARVSTRPQETRRQVHALRAAGCDTILQEKVQGNLAWHHRPALCECLENLRRGDQIVVLSVDRLGRDLADMLEIAKQLRERGASAYTIEERLTIPDRSFNLAWHLAAAFAEHGRENIKRAQASGIRAARAEGVRFGRPRACSLQVCGAILAMLEDPYVPIAAVAQHYQVSERTVRRIRDRIPPYDALAAEILPAVLATGEIGDPSDVLGLPPRARVPRAPAR